MLCKFLFAISVFYLITIQSLISAPLQVDVEAESAILVNLDTGKILFQKNIHERQYPASITKIATICYALSRMPDQFDETIVAQREAIASISPEAKIKRNYQTPAYWIEVGSSHVGIKLGEELTYRDLLNAVLLESANDASNVIAQRLGNGYIPQFIEELNAFIKQLGCTDTHFCNPHGLHHPDHYTTALDMAKITCAAMQNPTFRDIVKSVRYHKPKTNKQPASVFVQHNRLLLKGPYYYPYAIGVKTGATKMAKFTLVSAAQKGDRTLCAVVLRCPTIKDTYIDSKNLFESAFNERLTEKVILPGGEQLFEKCVVGCSSPLHVYTKAPLKIAYYPSEEPQLKCQIAWDMLEPPIEAHQKVGVVQLFADGKIDQEIPVYAKARLEAGIFYPIENILGSFGVSTGVMCAILVAFIGTFSWWKLARPGGTKRSRF